MVDRPPGDLKPRVNPTVRPERAAICRSMQRGQPYGSQSWQAAAAARLGLQSLLPYQAGHGSKMVPDPFIHSAQSYRAPTCSSRSRSALKIA